MNEPFWMPATGSHGSAQVEGSRPVVSGTIAWIRPIWSGSRVLTTTPRYLPKYRRPPAPWPASSSLAPASGSRNAEGHRAVLRGRMRRAQMGTRGTVEITPLRESWNDWSYEPRAMVWVTLLT